MMKIFACFTVFCLIFIGCENNDIVNAVKRETNGTIKFTCTSRQPFSIYIDKEYKGDIRGNSSLDFFVPPGEHNCYVIQKKGVLKNIITREQKVSVSTGEKCEFIFP